jgi:hypothetical protein
MIRSHRVSELGYESHSAWRHSTIEVLPKYSSPEWATSSHSPLLKPDVNFIPKLLPERPDCDFVMIFEDIMSRLDAIHSYLAVDNWLLPLSMPYWRKYL